MPEPARGRPVALVTGSASEIGKACLQRLRADGFTAVAGWHTREPSSGPAVRFDITDPAAVEAAIEQVESRWGPVAALVANAGRADVGLAIRLSPERYRRVVDINLTGTFLTARSAMGSMLRRRQGRIVVIGSMAGQVGEAGVSSYAASKSGLVGLVRSLAREAGPRQVTVNVVAPGMLADAAQRIDAHRGENQITSRWRNATPLGLVGTAQDVAATVSFLVSDRASFVTGALIPVDGGFSLGRA